MSDYRASDRVESFVVSESEREAVSVLARRDGSSSMRRLSTAGVARSLAASGWMIVAMPRDTRDRDSAEVVACLMLAIV
jgi:hypothetical protein